MVTVPERSPPVVLYGSERVVAPLPVPLVAVKVVNVGAEAVHTQSVELALMLMGCRIPRTSAAIDDGETVNVQPPLWLTGIDVPARITAPDCEGPVMSLAAVIRIEVLPVPPVALRVTHGGAEAVQAQPSPLVITLAMALPPPFGNKIDAFETVNVQVPLPAIVTGITCPATVTLPDSAALVTLVAAMAEIVAVPNEPDGTNVTPVTPETAVHAQELLLAVTVTGSVPPWLGKESVVGETANVHAVALWVTLTASPAMVSVAVKSWPVVLPCATTVSGSGGVPVPLDGFTVAHVALDVAVHAHVDWLAVRATGKLPPLLVNAKEVGLTAKLQGLVELVPFCVTVKLMPAIVMVPLRVLVAVLAVACRERVKLPVPR
jgi:hypothetical protein